MPGGNRQASQLFARKMENAETAAEVVAEAETVAEAATAFQLPLNLITRFSNLFWPFEMF